MTHKSGFVNIIGHPNIGKSTLLNALMGEKFSIITSKPQTTRHRIQAIYNDPEHQVIFSDTPGIIEDPRYKMHESMNKFAQSSFKDADIMLFMTDIFDEYEEGNATIARLKSSKCIKFLVINKIDLGDPERLKVLTAKWQEKIEFDETFLISAKEKHGTKELLNSIKSKLEEGPEYYPKDQMSDKSVRFFIEERIREKVLQQYKKEIPYSVEILVEEFKEITKRGKPFVNIRAIIFVARKSQKSIIIGREGAAIKKLGIASRRDIENFLECQIMLELFVKVKEDWRNNDNFLKQFGYQNKK